MKTIPFTQKELKDGAIFEIETIDKSDLRIAEISFNSKRKTFIIWFNGALIHSSITFTAMINRLDILNIKFPLEIN